MSLSWHPIFFERCEFWRKGPKALNDLKAPKALKALKKAIRLFAGKKGKSTQRDRIPIFRVLLLVFRRENV